MTTAPLLPYTGLPHAQTAPRRWGEVVPHLDARYGGLSACVPELTRSVGRVSRDVEPSLIAFCSAEEEAEPEGLHPEQVSLWPASRAAWARDWMRGGALRGQFIDYMRALDGVHIHGLWEPGTMLAASAAHRLRLPYIVSAHGMLEPWALRSKRWKKSLYAALIERRNLNRAACLHALTAAEAQCFRRFGATAPIAVIPNGVACPAERNPHLFLAQFPVLRGKRILLFLGRLHVKKGLSTLLRVWSQMGVAREDAHLVLAGPDDDGTGAQLERMCRELGLEHNVLFTGMLQGALKWSALSAAEAFVLPSLSEGFSVSVLEAMASGVPVLLTRPCNMSEVSRFGAGWEIEPEAAELAYALRQILLREPAANAAMGRRGRALVRERYSWQAVGTQMAELYRWIHGGPTPTSFELLQAA